MKYEFTNTMREISGFGGGYEDCCRKMVIAGVNWLDDHPEAIISYKEYKNVYGLTADESPDCTAMQEHMNKTINDEASGAMMQACTNHVMFIDKNGWAAYVQEMSKDEKQQA